MIDTTALILTHEHAPGTNVTGHRCEPRVFADCRSCRRRVVFCMPSDADLLAIMRRGYRCPACTKGGLL